MIRGKYRVLATIYSAVYMFAQVLLPILKIFDVNITIWQLFSPTIIMILPIFLLLAYIWLAKTINEIAERFFG